MADDITRARTAVSVCVLIAHHWARKVVRKAIAEASEGIDERSHHTCFPEG